MKKLFFVLIFLISSSAFSQPGWNFLNPTPTGNPILDIKMFNENTGIFMGTNEIMRTSNGGINWYKIYTPWAHQNISMSMVDSMKGFIALDSGLIVRTTNGGVSWYYASRINHVIINKILFQNSTTGHIITSTDTNYYGQKIFRTTNGGESWNQTLSEVGLNLYNIFFSSSVGYAVGEQIPGNSSYKSKIFKTTNDGVTWDSLQNDLQIRSNSAFFTSESTGYIGSSSSGPLFKTTNGGINWDATGHNYQTGALYFSGSDTGYIAYNNFLAKTTNGGLNWNYNYMNNLNGSLMNKLFVINKEKILTAGTTGTILKSTNGGTNWINYTKVSIGLSFTDVGFCDKNTGYLAGGEKFVMRTTNGGASFNTLRPPFLVGEYFYSMSVVNTNVVYGAYGNKVFKTTNMGSTWSTSTLATDGYGILKIKFINENTGFCVSKRIMFGKTTNGGNNWNILPILSYDENWSVDFYNENIGIAGGQTLMRTSNGGVDWDTLRDINNGTFIKYINRDTVFIAVNNGIKKSTNGGNSWVLTSLPGISYSRLEFPNAKTGYLSSYGPMYKTTDQGEHWFHINKGIYSSTISFSMVDSVTGFMAGYSGQILKTTDGGGGLSSIPSFPEYVPETCSHHQN